jgi:outer membrane protein
MPKLAAIIAMLGLFVPAARAEPRIPVMTLSQAIAFARAHQPSLAAARARADVARTHVDVAHAAYYPVVSAAAEALVGTANNTTASYGTLPLLDVTRVGGTPANAPISWSPEPSTLAGVAVHQELYDFGRNEDRADELDAIAHAAHADVQQQDLDLVLLVADSFYAVQGARAVLAASEAAVLRAREHADFAHARVTAQLRPPIDETRAVADLARYEVEQVHAAGALAVARSVLAAAIGATDPAVDAGSDDVAYRSPPAIDDGIRRLDELAPELASARDLLAAQQAHTRTLRDELRPELLASAELTGRAGGTAVANEPTPTGDGWLPSTPNWDALVVVSWPIFDRVAQIEARTSQRAEAVRAAEFDQARQQLHAAIDRAYVELDMAQAAMPALQRAVDAASANQAQADARFRAGLGDAVELSDSEALLVGSQIQLALGVFELSRARARVQRALAEVTP